MITEKRRAFRSIGRSDPADETWVKAALAHMVDVDQFVRGRFAPPDPKWSPSDKTAFTREVARRMSAADREHTAVLKRLIAKHGWFRISIWGSQADNQAWLLVQHADHDLELQEKVLDLLAELQAKGDTARTNYAYLFDRVAAIGHRRPQRFGTQGRCVGTGRWEPHPIEDPDHVDDRRAEVGLEPIADYAKRFTRDCL